MLQGDFDIPPFGNGEGETFAPYQDLPQIKEDEEPINKNDETEIPKRLLESLMKIVDFILK